MLISNLKIESNNGRKKIMEGLYYTALRPIIEKKIKNRTCGSVGMTSSSTLSLGFGLGWLHLHAKPDSPGLWWTDKASTIPPDSPSWEHHLKGALVEKVVQQGIDRVFEIYFASRSPYDAGGIRLIFEGTGRNANIILVRQTDDRILACLRKVLSGVNRFRAISPGVIYKSPPSSGYPPEEWASEKIQELVRQNVTPRTLYQNLEGVGPASARSIINNPGTVADTIKNLAISLKNQDFTPWQTEFGKVPVQLGEGFAITDPLAPPKKTESGLKKEEYRPSRSQLVTILKKRLSAQRKKARSSQKSLDRLVSPDDLRNWANLILTHKNNLRKGMKETSIVDWQGVRITIKLKESLNPVENANKYFRKAGKIHLEKNRLEKRILSSMESSSYLEDLLKRIETMADQEVTKHLTALAKPDKKQTGAPLEYILDGGWRCLVGRNAKQNDQLTFKIAGRQDIWLHARGITGAHVILKRDGRADNPSSAVMDQAAHIAAKHSSSNGVIPVDWTLAKYVRRMKGGGPGQVVYVREKTLFAEI